MRHILAVYSIISKKISRKKFSSFNNEIFVNYGTYVYMYEYDVQYWKATNKGLGLYS